MSLQRFFNKDSILTFAKPEFGQVYDAQTLKLIDSTTLVPADSKLTEGVAEAHLYSFYGDYLKSAYDIKYIKPSDGSNNITVDIRKLFLEFNITKGSFKAVININQNLFGTAFQPSLVASEISPDRTEVKFSLHSRSSMEALSISTLKSILSDFQSQNILNVLSCNFGSNLLYQIVNYWCPTEQDVIYIKFSQPLEDTILDLDLAWVCYQALDSYADTIILVNPVIEAPFYTLKGPNFSIDSNTRSSNATVFKTWNDLLDSDLPTTQGVINSILSGSSKSVTLNIDYTNFENYIYYSSAEDRLDIFKYKLEQLEIYDSASAVITNASGSSTIVSQGSVESYKKRKNAIISTFDPFEQWLYKETTSSIFSYDASGSLTPWPKYYSGSNWHVYHTTSSISTNWFVSASQYAIEYDRGNINRLYWSIPEHILIGEGNSDYITFVEMVATHFDNLHAYVRALTQIHERDEHPDRGTAAELLHHVAKSYGWHLQDARQLSSLWLYKLGTNSSGSLQYNGDLEVAPHEEQTHQIWKRVVNSLPYLLKTKGTSRSVKALMNIYGIAQTLLSIKEYGGPNLESTKPTFIEDRFSYALEFKGNQYVKLYRDNIPPASGSWGGVQRTPDTVEFRFNTNYSGSGAMNLWSILEEGHGAVANLSLHHISDIAPYSQSYSGSSQYGYLKFDGIYRTGITFYSSSVVSDPIPLFDDDFWTIRIYTAVPITSTAPSGTIFFEVASSKDYALGEIVHSSSFNWNPGTGSIYYTWGGVQGSSPDTIILGGDTGSVGDPDKNLVPTTVLRFSGSIQGYKEYFTTYSLDTFHSHVLNPGAYHTDSPSGSYEYLYRYFPLGLDVQRWDHSVSTEISSSQPNRQYSTFTTASLIGFTGSQQNQYTGIKEKYYIYTPTIGGQSLRSDKFRLEDSSLGSKALSATQRMSVGSYDKSAFDSNRLAIVFSLADHINRDVFNHMGFQDLDYLVGGARLEFESEYTDLKLFRKEYFKKYAQINNINSFINILSLYDYTFFEQIKQLVPGRADLIAGILVEPHILERSKVQLTKRPSITNPQWETSLTYMPSQSGEYLVYEGEVEYPIDLEVTYEYYSGSIERSLELEMEYAYYSGSITRPFTISAISIHHTFPTHSLTGIAGEVDCVVIRYSGSTAETGSMIMNASVPRKTTYCKLVYHYSGAGAFNNPYDKDMALLLSQSSGWSYSSSLVPVGYQHQEDGVENRKRFLGSKLTGPDFNIDSPDTIDGGPVVEVYESNPNSLVIKDDGRQGNLVIE